LSDSTEGSCPPPGLHVYPFAGGPTHEPPRAAHGKRCYRPLGAILEAVLSEYWPGGGLHI
jgi:hypothetical protein